MQPEIIAHRGASYLAPENTLSAFRLAKAMGADGVEFDVQMTKDDKLVIHHDYIIDFHTQLKGNIYDMLEGDLRELDFGSWKNVIFSDEKIPTLEEALDIGGELGTMMVELKSSVYPNANYVPEVIYDIEGSGYMDKCTLIAFEHDLLRQARQLDPDIKVGVLLFGALEGYFRPSPAQLEDWGLADLTNGVEDGEQSDLVRALSGEQALGTALDIEQHPEKYDEENGELRRWVNNQITMLKASFPGQSFYSILRTLGAQRDPAAYVRSLDFVPDYVSCEFHTAYVRPKMVEQLHELGVKVAFWTPDSQNAIRSLLPLQPDAFVTNRPDTVRRWMDEYSGS